MANIRCPVGICCQLFCSQPGMCLGHQVLQAVMREGSNKNVIAHVIKKLSQLVKFLRVARIAMNQNDGAIRFIAVGHQLCPTERIHTLRLFCLEDFSEVQRLGIVLSRSRMRGEMCTVPWYQDDKCNGLKQSGDQ